MNINEEKRHQWQALKGMGFKAHWDYFWDYYKIHVIVALIVIIGIASFAKEILTRKPDAISVTIVNAANTQDATLLHDEFAEYEKIDTSQYNVLIDSSSVINIENPDSYTVANSERLYAMIAAHDLDVLMADKDVFDNYAKSELFLDLRECFSEEELKSFGDAVYYFDTADYNSNGEYDMDTGEYVKNENVKSELIPVGIVLNDNPHLTAMGFYPGVSPIVGLAVSSERTDVGADFIRFLMQ
ncbi:hypothetical protein SAMN04487770_10298 [Butyrivibrio sp. ob235]|uniref:hypothetical protein n=1 Tax=Butyrivibrio sp. ob235 TaxID=1761780 RepID=UPI0008BA7888|nr:hypothetical protein [Butyrivibrio sp. ob235]SEK62004.1 hypothetical protein SAMN04487770_10298 [Butyrivibrio sp. ob235]